MPCDHRHLLTFMIALAGAAGALACGGAYRAREWAEIVDEEALIVWNPATKIEHFVRRAAFKTRAQDFGFLVPTPTKPTLGEVDDALFSRLASATKPEEREEWGVRFMPASCQPFMLATRDGARSARAPGAVRVLDVKHVAGFDAVVLEADDATALAKWLADHGYETRPALAAWLEKYVAERWKITAFKLSAPEARSSAAGGERTMAPKSVRLSFTAERPFFPYREPAEQRERPGFRRTLRLFLVGPKRLEGSLDLPQPQGWNAREYFSDAVADLGRVVGDAVPAADVPQGSWLTSFVDESNPRNGVAELVFAPSEKTAPHRPSPVVHQRWIWIPADLVLGLVLIVGRRIRRSKK